MYPNPFRSESPYTGQSLLPDRCPICGSIGECSDAAPVPMPYPPVDIGDDSDPATPSPLRLYTVTAFGFTSTMRLNDTDAARYGDAAVLNP